MVMEEVYIVNVCMTKCYMVVIHSCVFIWTGYFTVIYHLRKLLTHWLSIK